MSVKAQMFSRVVLCIIAVAMSSCAAANAAQYYKVYSDSAVYIAWTEDSSGHLQGQVEMLGVDPSDSTKLQTRSAAFTGTRSGSDVSLVFGMLSNFGGQTWTGHIGWHSLDLIIPTNNGPTEATLSAGSFSEFQSAAARFRASVARSQYNQGLASTINDTANRLRDAGTRIKNALADLAHLFPAHPGDDTIEAHYADVWQKMQDDWGEEKADADVTPFTCYQKSKVQYASSKVDYELSQIQYYDGRFSSGSSEANADFRAINEALSSLQYYAPLYDQQYSAYSQATAGVARNPQSVRSLPALRRKVQPQVAYYQKRLLSTRSIAYGYDQKAAALDQQAKAFPDTLSCSD